ncbi:MAG: ABC transporter substrate-binding protein [Methanocorpusculum sp.]|nr:ABC transporter substrate-binding protein [Methanocorpusculum sp.]
MTHQREEGADPKLMKIEKRITVIILVVTVILFLVAVHPLWPMSPSAGFPEGKLTVFVTMPMSGGQEEFGVAYARGVQLAVEDVNAGGGIRGHELEAVYYDNLGGDFTELQEEFSDAFANEVPLIIGPLTSSSALMLGMYAETFGLVMITPSATSAELSKYNTYVFRTVSSDAYLGSGMVKIINHIKDIRSIAVVYCDDSYGDGICKTFSEEMNLTSPETKVVQIMIDTDSPVNASNVMSAVRGAEADAVFIIPGSPQQVVDLLTEAEATGMDLMWFGTDNSISSLISDYGEYADGFVGVTPSLRINSVVYEEKYQKKFGTDMKIVNSIYGYDTMMLAAQAMSDYGYKPEELAEGLQNIRYLGLTGPITFDKNGDRYPSYDIVQLWGGEWVTLKWSSALSFGSEEGHSH